MQPYILLLILLLSAISVHAQTDSTAIDSVLLKQIEQDMNTNQNNQTPVVQQRTSPSTNPNISVIGDFRLNYSNNQNRHFDANLHETEFSLQSTIDPYAKAATIRDRLVACPAR